MKIKKEVLKTFVILGIFLILAGSVSAFAVSSAYWEENPLKIYPGQTVEAFIVLQNLAGDTDLTVEGIVTQGQEFIEFVEDSNIYEVPKGQKVEVHFLVSVPEYAVLGDEQEFVLSFRTILDSESGEFGFGSGVEREIPFVVVDEPKIKKTLAWWVYLVMALAVILVVVGIIILSKKKKKKK